MKTSLLLLSICSFFLGSVSKAGALARYNIDAKSITISGISSGAFMAVQMGVAYSETFSGVSSIAGGIYGCALGQVSLATQGCMKTPEFLDVPFYTAYTERLETFAQIDPVENLRKQRIYIFSSTGDQTVDKAAGEKLKTYYQHFISSEQILLTAEPVTAHGFPTLHEGGPCQQGALPWILNCNFDAAAEILRQMYGDLSPRGIAQDKNLMRFDQNAFGGPGASLESDAWIYVPEQCQKMKTCKLHVALHGCQMNSEFIQDQFVKKAGYNEWAESNDIIVLYPQAAKGVLNPNACWDWFGYTGPYYATKLGPQMSALIKMIQHLRR